MISNEFLSISWSAPIEPSKSMVGIPIGLELEKLKILLTKYLVGDGEGLYLFDNAPFLKLESFAIDADGNGHYHFILADSRLTHINNEVQLKDTFYSRALHIMLRSYKVFAIKVWAFEHLYDDELPEHSYRGRTKEGIGLYDEVSKFLPYSHLEFDEAEEWFYTDRTYGGLEVTGYGRSLKNFPDQVIMAITVIPESPMTQ